MQLLSKVFCVLLFLFISIKACARIPDGSRAPDWTLKDFNGNEHNLYQVLESGKHVILQFAASWCTASWKYHRSGRLKTIWEMYGPAGTNELMIFLIEADLKTTSNCLRGNKGCSGGTTGNWLAKTPYPVINLSGKTGEKVFLDYNIRTFPEIYLINARDKRAFNVGQLNIAGWQSWLYQSFPMYTMSRSLPSSFTASGQDEYHVLVFNGAGTKQFQWNNGAKGDALISPSEGLKICRITDTNGYFIINEVVIDAHLDFSTEVTDIQNNHWELSSVYEEDTGFESGIITLEPKVRDQEPASISEEFNITEILKKQNEPDKNLYRQKNFSLYPNPANRYCNIDAVLEDDQNADLFICDDSGKIMLYENVIGKKTVTLDLGELRQGVYYVIFKHNQILQTQKLFIVE